MGIQEICPGPLRPRPPPQHPIRRCRPGGVSSPEPRPGPRGRGFRGGHLAAGPRRGRPRGGACRGGAAGTGSRRRCRAGAPDATAPRQG